MEDDLKTCPLCKQDGYYSVVNEKQWVFCEAHRLCGFGCSEKHWQAMPRHEDSAELAASLEAMLDMYEGAHDMEFGQSDHAAEVETKASAVLAKYKGGA